VSPLSLLTFFAAAKKVSAAPHRGEANRPLRIQGKANAERKPPKRHAGKKQNAKSHLLSSTQ
jgi:general secretion pathway protein K